MNNNDLLLVFDEFQKMPKMALVDRPDELIMVCPETFFTRRTLKHLAEKGEEGRRLFGLIISIRKNPDLILEGNGTRSLFVRFIPDDDGDPHVAVIEKVGVIDVIVTMFATNKKYLKNFKILWRTESSIS